MSNFLKKHKSWILFFALGLVIILVYLLVFQIKIQNHLEKNIHTDLEEIRNNASFILNSEINEFISHIKSEARTISLLGELSEEELKAELKSFEKPKTMLRAHILTTDGNYYSSLENDDRKYDPKDYEDSLKEDNQNNIGVPRFSQTFQKTVVEIPTPLYVNGKYTGILVGCYDIESFEKLLFNNFLKGDCSIWIMSSDGTVISKSSLYGDYVSGEGNMYDFYKSDKVKFVTGSFDTLYSNIQNGLPGFSCYKSQNRLTYLSYMPTGIRDWNIAATATNKTLNEESDVIKEYAFEPALGVLLIVILIAVFIFMSSTRENTRTQKLLQKAAETDFLTGINNRSAVEKKIERFLQGEGISGNHALFMMDIDGFKNVNDKLGHIKGDKILEEFGASLKQIFSENELIGRIGGDEFIVLIPNFSDKSYVCDKAAAICDNLRKTYFSEENETITVKTSASVGISIYQKDGSNFHDLYKSADIALYNCKNNGKDNFSFFEEA